MMLALNYHYIRPFFKKGNFAINGMTPIDFENQLKILSKKFNFLSSNDIVAAIKDQKPIKKNSAIVTFDDGLREQYDYALPILKKNKIAAIFYVNTQPLSENKVSEVHKIHLLRSTLNDVQFKKEIINKISLQKFNEYIDDTTQINNQYKYDNKDTAILKYILNFKLSFYERRELLDYLFKKYIKTSEKEISQKLYMNPYMLKKLADCNYLGTHCHEHLPIESLNDVGIYKQILNSLDYFKSIDIFNINSISYPYGGYSAVSKRVANIAKDLGIIFGFTMERALNSNLNNPLLFARFSNDDLPGGKHSNWTLEQVPNELPKAKWFNC